MYPLCFLCVVIIILDSSHITVSTLTKRISHFGNRPCNLTWTLIERLFFYVILRIVVTEYGQVLHQIKLWIKLLCNSIFCIMNSENISTVYLFTINWSILWFIYSWPIYVSQISWRIVGCIRWKFFLLYYFVSNYLQMAFGKVLSSEIFPISWSGFN